MNRLATCIALATLAAGTAAYGWKIPSRDFPKGISLETASAAEQKGDVARARNDYLMAVAYYQRAVRSGTPNVELYNKLGIMQLKLQDRGAARKSFQQAIKLDPHSAEALNNLGALYCLDKKYKQALKYLKQALEIDEQSAVYHVNMAEAWVGLSQIDRAMTEYARALELDPDILNATGAGVIARVQTPEQRARLDYLVAKLYARKGNIDGALDYLQRAKNEHFAELSNVYSDKEFAVLWQDPRLKKIVKP